MYLTFEGIKSEVSRNMIDVPRAYFFSTDMDVILQNVLDDFASVTRLLRLEGQTYTIPAGSGALVIGEDSLLGSNLYTTCGQRLLDFESVEWNWDSSGVSANENFKFLSRTHGREEFMQIAGFDLDRTDTNPRIWWADTIVQTPGAGTGSGVTTSPPLRRLHIWPRPTDTTNARLKWTGHRTHTRIDKLDKANSYPEFPQETGMALVHYICMWLYERDQRADMAQMHRTLYQAELIKATGTLDPSRAEFPDFSTVKNRVYSWGRGRSR